ncbi:MAG: MBL fold metallo-hydrolase [Actinomyces sp.]|nr:MAG: MBL fold metallo-hydrolase [Actinomyces sp.]
MTTTDPPATPVHRKQEQEPAGETVTEVAPGILRLQLPIDMPGLGHVNCYVLEDADGVALVDPGLPGEASWRALTARLASAGIPLARVHTAVVTHSHPDHFGGSDQLREETGAEILTHEAFREQFPARDDDLDDDLLAASEDELIELWKLRFAEMGPTPWGTRREPPPDEIIRRWIVSGARGHHRFRAPEPTVRVTDGQPVRLAGRDWFAVHTPGHTTDHLCLWDPTEGALLAGDHVLPTITPHIAGATELDDPLAAFFASLERVGSLEGVRTVLPAHGHPFADLAARTAAIRVHHEERLELLRRAAVDLVDAPVEAWMKVLFSPRAWGHMAESETFAHLEHLRVCGEARRRRDNDGLLRFTITRAA